MIILNFGKSGEDDNYLQPINIKFVFYFEKLGEADND